MRREGWKNRFRRARQVRRTPGSGRGYRGRPVLTEPKCSATAPCLVQRRHHVAKCEADCVMRLVPAQSCPRMPVRMLAFVVALAVVVAVAAPRKIDRSAPRKVERSASVAPPAPDAPLPANAPALAARLVGAHAGLRAAVAAWRASGQAAPSDEVTLYALYVQRALRML